MDRIDFWVQLGVSTFWAAIIVAGITAFLAGMALIRLIDRGQINTLKAQKDFADDRLRQATERITGESKTIADLQERLGELEKTVAADKASLSLVEPILKKLISDTGTLASSNNATMKILQPPHIQSDDQVFEPTVTLKSN